jgi:hypothetical protein
MAWVWYLDDDQKMTFLPFYPGGLFLIERISQELREYSQFLLDPVQFFRGRSYQIYPAALVDIRATLYTFTIWPKNSKHLKLRFSSKVAKRQL